MYQGYKVTCTIASLLLLAIAVTSSLGQCPDECKCASGGQLVNCTGAALTSVPAKDVSRSVVKLLLQNNAIQKLGDDDFYDYVKLVYLDLHSNKLRIVNSRSFFKLHNLSFLDLSRNHIAKLPEAVFRNQQYLVTLNLGHNNLAAFENEIFEHCPRMSVLMLQSNHITNKVFYKIRPLKQLKVLDLSNNPIAYLPYSMLAGTIINDIRLGHAEITGIHETAFNTMSNLEYININNNMIRSFHINTFKDIEKLMEVNMKKNPIECNCNLTKIINGLLDDSVIISTDQVRCRHLSQQIVVETGETKLREDFCLPKWTIEKTTTTSKSVPTTSVTNAHRKDFCMKLIIKLEAVVANITSREATIFWSVPYLQYKQSLLEIEIKDAKSSTITHKKSIKVEEKQLSFDRLHSRSQYSALISVEECGQLVELKFTTSDHGAIIEPEQIRKEHVMNWTYIYIGSIIGALVLLLAITCAVACFLLSKRKQHLRHSKRRPITMFTGSLERNSTRLSSGMNSLQRTGVCIHDQTDNLYESIARVAPSTAIATTPSGDKSASLHRYAVEYSHSPPPGSNAGSDSYARMTLSGDSEYLQPSPGPVPAPRVPTEYANSPLLESGRHSMHQYEPDTKPTTFH